MYFVLTIDIVGGFLQRVINDTQAFVKGTLTPTNRKLFLYSAHETHVFYLLTALGVNLDTTIPYGGYIAIELHEINQTYGIKVCKYPISKSV